MIRSDNKVSLGGISVDRNVVADICAVAIRDVEGVTLARNETLENFLSVFGIRYHSAVDVRIDERQQVNVVIRVNMRYGLNLTATSQRVQDVVMTAVDKMADINLRDVDVDIRGIERG